MDTLIKDKALYHLMILQMPEDEREDFLNLTRATQKNLFEKFKIKILAINSGTELQSEQ